MNFIFSLFQTLFIQHPILGLNLIILLLFKLFFKQISGKTGEFWVKRELKKLPKDKYLVINDVMIYSNNSTHQIDHIVISEYGIFVIETKMYTGFITGNEYDKKWSKHYGKLKYYFNNPIHQNYGHVLALEEILTLDKSKFIPIVCFPARELKIKVSSNHHISRCVDLNNIITSYKNCIISNTDKIYDKIVNHNIKDKKVRKEHVKNIKKNIIKNEKDKCPKCGGNLVERNGKYGNFIGCSNYPRCKYTTK